MHALFPAVVAMVMAGLVILGSVGILLYRHLQSLKHLQNFEGVWSIQERHSVRLSAVSIWTNVLALVLIALVAFFIGAGQIGLDLWSARERPSSSSTLEELLQKRLPDRDVQQSQHQELIDAIRDRTPPVATDDRAIRAELSKLQSEIADLRNAEKNGFSGVQAAGTIAWIIIIALSAASAFLVLKALKALFDKKWSKSLIDAVCAVVLFAISGTGESKLKSDLKGEYSIVKSLGHLLSIENINIGRGAPTLPPEPPDVNVYLHFEVGHGSDAVPSVMDCGEADGQRVTPFNDGAVTLDADGEKILNKIAADIEDRINGKHDRPSSILLIGSADKRGLKPETASLYNSNAGLAQARIGVVRAALEKVLEKHDPPIKPPIMEFYAGPAKTSAKSTREEWARDRAVQVCVFWDHKP